MANKVLSIKMDEKDIERLRKYYNVLTRAGFLSSKTMSLNAFYKHLLLDYLEDDVHRVFAIFSNYGISPRCINPEELSKHKNITINNTYNLETEMFENYIKCVKEALNRSVSEMKEYAKMFNEVVESEIIVTEGWMYKMECISCLDLNENIASFWDEKAAESMISQEKEFNDNEIEGEVVMIEKSSLSEELKQKLIEEIKKYNIKRMQNYSILRGKGIKD